MQRTIALLLIAVLISACAGSYENIKGRYPYLSEKDFNKCFYITGSGRESCYSRANELSDPVLLAKLQKQDYESYKRRNEWLSWDNYLACKKEWGNKHNEDRESECMFVSSQKNKSEAVKRTEQEQQRINNAKTRKMNADLEIQENQRLAAKQQQFNAWRHKAKIGDTCWAGPPVRVPSRTVMMFDAPVVLGEIDAMLHCMVIEVKYPIFHVQFDGLTDVGVTVNLPHQDQWVKSENIYPANEYQVKQGTTVYTPSSWPQ